MGVNAEEMASWRDAAKSMRIPFDEVLGVHPQSEGFTDHQVWDFDGTPPEMYPLLLHVPYFDLYRKQVSKQADLVLAMQLRPDAFPPEQMARNFGYYEAITVRDSSLSACTQAVVAAWTGHLDLAYDYLAEAALVDLNNLAGNSDHGVHIASMAGTWTAVVSGFGGMQLRQHRPAVRPAAAPCPVADLVRAAVAGSRSCAWRSGRRRRSTAGQWAADATAPPR